uniref:Uncharacterized protein n=1 Tax=Tanacetum cinerariifolium TaxID=118510 RepID=A0A699H2L9_TANCI|nr:hypothetical protein [Tanacetum cinerariifolium]
MLDIGMLRVRTSSGQCWQFILQIIYVELQCHELREVNKARDSEDSTATYTEVSCAFEGLSDIGSPGVEGPPVIPEDPYAYVVAAFQAPPLPYYVPGPEEPEQAPPLPVFVLEPVYPKFMPLDDEILPTTFLRDPKEDPTNYPADGGDDDDDDGSSDDDEDDDDDDNDDVEKEEEEEEHPASANSIPPPPVHRTTARISIPVQAPASFWSEAEIDRLHAIPSPPPSLLSSWSLK